MLWLDKTQHQESAIITDNFIVSMQWLYFVQTECKKGKVLVAGIIEVLAILKLIWTINDLFAIQVKMLILKCYEN